MRGIDFDRVFGALARVRVAVVGDFCLDHYLIIDPDHKELSVETGLPVRGVAEERSSPGGAGNVAANLTALGVKSVHCVGCLGDDPYGTCLVDILGKVGCDTSGLFTQREGYATRAYVKPYCGGEEESRFDHGVANRITPETTRKIVSYLEKTLPELDAVILNQQVLAGVWTDELFVKLNDIQAAGRFPRVAWVVDSRDRPKRFRRMVVKLNDNEAARLHGRDVLLGEQVTQAETGADVEYLFELFGGPVVITRGGNGAVARDATGTYSVPGVHIVKMKKDDIDTVGAGDTFTSGLAACLGAGLGMETAVTIANLAAAVTVRKLRQTGTAAPAEIRALGSVPDYVYEPELAGNPRRARHLLHLGEGLDLEIVTRRSRVHVVVPATRRGFTPGALANVRFALFDHDGTVSCLREGWERVMEPMMVRAILGERHDEVDDRTYRRVLSRVRRYIDQSAGVATLKQMQGLVGMVREFGFVPEDGIKDEHGYKAVYNEALMKVVNDRIARLERGERSVEDYLIKGAVEFLTGLRERGIRLALASGTDQADVLREATILGYADLFEGGIHGATGDPDHCSKRTVMDGILAGREEAPRALLVCGDGPVELREGRRRGGVALGVASDELRRYGWNMAKRARLIRAGADYLVPDWSQHARLLEALFG